MSHSGFESDDDDRGESSSRYTCRQNISLSSDKRCDVCNSCGEPSALFGKGKWGEYCKTVLPAFQKNLSLSSDKSCNSCAGMPPSLNHDESKDNEDDKVDTYLESFGSGNCNVTIAMPPEQQENILDNLEDVQKLYNESTAKTYINIAAVLKDKGE